MTSVCERLDAFFDGELPGSAAQAFREHLASCAYCQRTLRGRMGEAAVVARVANNTARPPSNHAWDQLAMRRSRRSRRWAVIVGGVAAACALLLLWRKPLEPPPVQVAAVDERSESGGKAPRGIDIPLAAERPFEARFSSPALDQHRPLHVVRSAAPAAHEGIKATVLAALEQRGDVHGLVAARALNGEISSARESAKQLPATAQALADRAALELLTVDGATEAIPWPRQQQAAEQAISLAAAALRMDPRCIQASWNKAIAFKRLRLPLAAAQAFDEIAARGEPGWSNEARDNAARLRSDHRAEHEDRTRLQSAAMQMIGGGVPIDAESALRSPSQARRALYQAVATASTVNRLDALLPLARTLDGAFSTTVMVALVGRARASNLAAQAPIARALGEVIVNRAKPAELKAVRDRALRLGLTDVVLASFLAQADRSTSDADLALLGKLLDGTRDPWWRTFELMRRTYVLQYITRDSARAEQTARTAAPLCRASPSLWCERIEIFAGAANADMGRLDIALEQLSRARQMAREPATRDDEGLVLDALAQAISTRAHETIDPGAVSDAYFSEYALRSGTCTARLQRLDFVAAASLDRHHHRQAAEFRAQADALERGECQGSDLRLNGETVRLRLVEIGHGDVAALHREIDTLEAGNFEGMSSYVRFLRAAATASTDRARGEPALRDVVEYAEAHADEAYATPARALGYAALIELAAAAGEADNVMALVARRLRVPAPERCAVGIAQWNRVVIAVRGMDGRSAVARRDVPEGLVVIPPAELITPALQAGLAGCARVEVISDGPYFGMANILGPTVAWAYRGSRAAPAKPAQRGGELVITDVTPPDDIHLPQLRSFQGAPSAVVLRKADATPGAALAKMKTAGLIVIVAHGHTDARVPAAASLILSPDRDGDYLLTASKVSTAQLDKAPVVVLAGCDAGRVQVSAEPWSLATSFLQAGARAVIAPTEQIPDAAASEAFDSLVARLRSGVDPIDALRAERTARGPAAAWISSIVVFE